MYNLLRDLHIAQHAIIQETGMARDLPELNALCVQIMCAQLVDGTSHVYVFGTYHNKMPLRQLYHILLLNVLMLIMLMSIFYLFVSLTWIVHHWGAMHVQLFLY